MQTNESRSEGRYAKNVLKLTISIVLFVATYLILLCLALAVFAFCIFTSVILIGNGTGGESVMVAVILLNLMGGYLLYTVLKFLFQIQKHDTSTYIAISDRSEPKLFELVAEIAASIGTDFPERIFFTLEPTAFVFYDANFRALLFTPKKSLCIGISLLDSISVTELRAIIAHELGHFSQKSMRFGAYFTVINTVSYAILEENNKFTANQPRDRDPTNGLQIGAFISGIAAVPMRLVFKLVNKNFLALSRQMEFHADEVAAKAVAADALASSLLRLDLVSLAYSNALDHIVSKAPENKMSENIFPQVKWLLDLYGKMKNCEFKEGIPQVTLPLNQSIVGTKLVLDAQWKSHPSISDRLKHLNTITPSNQHPNDQPASSIIQNLEKLQKIGTKRIYTIKDSTMIKPLSDAEFSTFFKQYLKERAHDPIFNEYYLFHDPAIFDIEMVKKQIPNTAVEFASLYSIEKVTLAVESNILPNDISALEISQTQINRFKTFDYNGFRYEEKDWKKLHSELIAQQELTAQLLQKNDVDIFCFFQQISSELNHPNLIPSAYKAYFDALDQNTKMNATFQEFIRETDFISASDGLEDFDEREELEEKTAAFRNKVPDFKSMIDFVLNDSDYLYVVNLDQKRALAFSDFLNSKLSYWDGLGFDHEEVAVLSAAISAYTTTLIDAKTIFLKTLTDTLAECFREYNQVKKSN